MPTDDRRRALSLEAARERAPKKAFTASGPKQCVGCVGLEQEFFPISFDSAGRPTGRLPLSDGTGGVVEVVDGLAEHSCRVNRRQRLDVPGPWEFGLAQGGRLTFEPGAQVEHSTAVRASAAEALSDIQGMVATLQEAFAERNVALASLGRDLWHDVTTVPQQLEMGRYVSQAAYYDRRGPWGAVMMRNTASLQINLDLGPEGVWQERYLLANLLAPLITAAFACSPGEGMVSTRARAWQELDPSRTGFPSLLVEGAGSDPRAAWAEAAVDADVMLFRLANGDFEAGEPGFSFGRWIADGHPRFGWPTMDDFDYHLTTLFLEVRPRGFFELRTCEALPDEWRAAPVVLVSSLLYEKEARAAAIAALAPMRARLPELWRRAAEQGLRDHELAENAAQVFTLALEAAEGIAPGFYGEHDLEVARDFVERYTLRGKMPADTLAELIAEDPAKALAWATSGWSAR